MNRNRVSDLMSGGIRGAFYVGGTQTVTDMDHSTMVPRTQHMYYRYITG